MYKQACSFFKGACPEMALENEFYLKEFYALCGLSLLYIVLGLNYCGRSQHLE